MLGMNNSKSCLEDPLSRQTITHEVVIIMIMVKLDKNKTIIDHGFEYVSGLWPV